MKHENVEFDIYFIRHGESESNATPGIAAGENFNAPMTERGHLQAEALGRRLAAESVHFDRIYSSSLIRAVQTTEGMLKGLGIEGVEFHRVDDIIERQIPAWRGKMISEVLTPEVLLLQAVKGKWFQPADGESHRTVERRASQWIEDELINNEQWLSKPGNHTIAVISHGDTMRTIFHYITGWDTRFIPRTEIHNCSISRFRFDRGGWWVVSINDAGHTAALGDVVRENRGQTVPITP